MKTKHIEYLNNIGIKNLIKNRIEEIQEFYSKICPEEIEDLIISEYIKEDGTRIYENLRFFSKNFVMLASNFLHEDRFNFAPNPITELLAVRVEKKDYDFKLATVKSRLTITLFCSDNFNAILKASKENCDYLKNILEKWYLPRLKK